MRSLTALFLAIFVPAAAEAQPSARPGSVAPPNMQAVAPALAGYTDEVLFGDVWRRPGLTPRDRSLVVVSALIAGGNTEQLRGHLTRALDNGVQPAELSEAVTQLAFYAGWPRAVSAVNVLAQVFDERGIKLSQTSETGRGGLRILRPGPPQRGSANNFTGEVEVTTPFTASAPARAGGATVRFQPGARTAWHTHPLGQTLIVIEGAGRVQAEGGPVEEILPGDVVWIPPGQRHWHGAAPSSPMTHVAIAESLNGKVVDWMEPVTDAQYRAARVSR